MSGIVTGVIAQRFGARNCGIVGGIFFSTGLLISSFATSTIYLQLSYGVVSGRFSLLLSILFFYNSSLQIIHEAPTIASTISVGTILVN